MFYRIFLVFSLIRGAILGLAQEVLGRQPKVGERSW